MSNLSKLSDEELVALQQENSVKRGEAETKYRERGQEIQFEMDKRHFRKQLGGAPSPAALAALAELQAEAEAAPAESEDES